MYGIAYIWWGQKTRPLNHSRHKMQKRLYDYIRKLYKNACTGRKSVKPKLAFSLDMGEHRWAWHLEDANSKRCVIEDLEDTHIMQTKT